MKEVQGEAKTVRELLGGRKYAIDDYQREYKWKSKQVSDLLEDLSSQFQEDYEESHERSEVAGYGRYFLGSIIVSRRNGTDYIVDGQQRLTTLTLLLIHLRHLQGNVRRPSKVDDLILSEKFGAKSFNINVPERNRAIGALYRGESFDDTDQPESVRNILSRYRDIQEDFPEDVAGEAVPYFTDWLKESVYLVEITAYSDGDAYTIFETMNDRGLSLAPADMLKGYLVSKIKDPKKRKEANRKWKAISESLLELGKDEVADFLKAWLRAQYAQNIRKTQRGAKPRDFDRIGTEFHRWVREHSALIGLKASRDFSDLIHKDIQSFASTFKSLRQASMRPVPGLQEVLFVGDMGFTLQYPVLLAPLRPGDSESVINQKTRIGATFLDILLARRIWNWRSIAYSTMRYTMFQIMREIRRKDPGELVEILTGRLNKDEETFSTNETLSLHSQNRWKLHLLLARMTDYLEQNSGLSSHYHEYVATEVKNRYEVEHIWANKPERHKDEFPHPNDFEEYRNRIGGLLLLPKKFNQSYGALAYEDKLEHYDAQNLLARSLHPSCYRRNPGFKRFRKETGLPFRSHTEFRKADLDARQKLYQGIAERVWDPARLESLLA